jgi:hypothetical protein
MNPKNPSWIGGMAAVATAGVLALAAPAWSGTKCNLRYSLAGWAAIYSTASGTGTATCDNGQSARVSLRATGGGLTAGKSKIVNGTGTFSEVSNINELFGKYASVEAHDGMVGSWAAQVVTKATTPLAFSGTGKGVDLGSRSDSSTSRSRVRRGGGCEPRPSSSRRRG